MNFLQLCQKTALDSGTVAGVPNFNTVAAATGRVAQVVGWVSDAYVDIQNERGDWRWMQRAFEAQLTAGQKVYTAAALGVADLGKWLPDIPALNLRRFTIWENGKREHESEIQQIDYMDWRRQYQRGVHATSQPTEWAISPQNELLVGVTPDKPYWISGEYVMTPQVLAADADIPLMPAAYHRIIIQEAIRLMARSDESYSTLVDKSDQYTRLRSGLVNSQTPEMSFGSGSFA